MRKSGKNIALVGAIAAGIGYVAGILTAPKSGTETRKDIKKTAVEGTRSVEKKIKNMHAEVSSLIEKNHEKIDQLTGKAKTELKNLVGKAEDAKTKAGEVLSALHEGEAEDEDLQHAVTQLKTAVENLKKFAKKPVQKTKQ